MGIMEIIGWIISIAIGGTFLGIVFYECILKKWR